MKRTFYLFTLNIGNANRLIEGMKSHFRFYGLTIKFDEVKSELSYEMASIGQPMDDIRTESISCYVNGFYAAVKE